MMMTMMPRNVVHKRRENRGIVGSHAEHAFENCAEMKFRCNLDSCVGEPEGTSTGKRTAIPDDFQEKWETKEKRRRGKTRVKWIQLDIERLPCRRRRRTWCWSERDSHRSHLEITRNNSKNRSTTTANTQIYRPQMNSWWENSSNERLDIWNGHTERIEAAIYGRPNITWLNRRTT